MTHMLGSILTYFILRVVTFQLLKDKLTTTPVLTLSGGTEGFVIYCDTYQVILSCALI